MRRSISLQWVGFFLPALVLSAPGAAFAFGAGESDAPAVDYQLANGLSRWSPTALSGTLIEGFAPVAARQEFRLSAVTPERLEWRDALGVRLPADSLSGLDRPRATYRYTWLSLPEWDFKVGLSATLDQMGPLFRSNAANAVDRPRFGSLPLMHLSGLGRIGDRWSLSLSADGMRTPRGQAVDLDLRVDYSLGRQMALYGGYRMVDTTGEALDVYGAAPSSSANVGVRLRF